MRRHAHGLRSVLLLTLATACSTDGKSTNTRENAGAPTPPMTPQVVDQQGGTLQGEAAAAAQRQAASGAARPDSAAKAALQPLTGSAMQASATLRERGEQVAFTLDVQRAKPGAARVAVRESGGCPAPEAQGKVSASSTVPRETGLGTLTIDEQGAGKLEVALQDANLKTEGHGSLLGKALVVYRMLPPARPGERGEQLVACGQIAPE